MLGVMLLSFASCRNADGDIENNGADSTVNTNIADNKESQSENDPIEFFKTDEETYIIETAYGPLKFPVKWKDYTFTETVQSGDTYGVAFTAVFGEERFSLYTIAFGNALGGYKLGTVNTENGEDDVYLIDAYNEAIEMTSEENRDVYYQMCEDVNVIISKLVYDSGMVLAD